MNRTQAEQCALDIQTNEVMRTGVFAILKAEHVATFKDGSMFLDANRDETTTYDVMQRHNFQPYAFLTPGAERTFCSVNHSLASALFMGGTGKKYTVLAFDGWESKNGDQMAEHPRFLVAHDVTAAVLAANEAEEIGDEDLEAASAFMG